MAARRAGEDLWHSLEDKREVVGQRVFADAARRLHEMAEAAGADRDLRLRLAIAFGAHAVASCAAESEWLAMRATERAVRAVRPPCSIALLKEWERTQIAYWTVYVRARAKFEPAMSNIALEVSSRMEAWYHYTAEHEQEWVRAGRPRAIPRLG
jgi:hypothetical protein